MENQDWTPVVIKRRGGARAEGAGKGSTGRVDAKELAHKDAARKARAIEEKEVGKVKHVSTESRAELARVRIEKGMSQAQADAACGLPRNTFNGLESGKIVPTGDILSKVARGIHVNIKLE
jgi:DNA-binding XRE family transcriptional regulator